MGVCYLAQGGWVGVIINQFPKAEADHLILPPTSHIGELAPMRDDRKRKSNECRASQWTINE
jgi:hypothetical protein